MANPSLCVTNHPQIGVVGVVTHFDFCGLSRIFGMD